MEQIATRLSRVIDLWRSVRAPAGAWTFDFARPPDRARQSTRWRNQTDGRTAAWLQQRLRFLQARRASHLFGADHIPVFQASAESIAKNRSIESTPSASGAQTQDARPGKPTDNAFVESFNGTLRDECLNVHRFETLTEAKQLIEAWRQEYNESRPRGALKDRMPSEFANEYAASRVLTAT